MNTVAQVKLHAVLGDVIIGNTIIHLIASLQRVINSITLAKIILTMTHEVFGNIT